MFKQFVFVLLLLAVSGAYADTAGRADAGVTAFGPEYPRLAVIDFSGQLNQKGVADRLVRFDLVILGAAAPVPLLLRDLKRQRPDILIGLYTVLNEARRTTHTPLVRERLEKIDKEDWWLKNAQGVVQRWTAKFDTWDVNVSEWSKPDADGLRYPEWAAKFWYRHLFRGEPNVDFWFFDNFFVKQRLASADWKGEGRDQSGEDPDIKAAFRRAQRLEVDVARHLSPSLSMLGNVDNDLGSVEYKGVLDGALIECIVGQKWSIEARLGWLAMMKYYAKVSENVRNSDLMVFGTCLNDFSNFKEFRYAFTSYLMGGGYFQVADQSHTYREQPWFDEFSIRLGKAIDGPFPVPDLAGCYQRRFERGVVLVNPSELPIECEVGDGYRRVFGRQAPEVNSGRPVGHTLNVPARDGIVLVVR